MKKSIIVLVVLLMGVLTTTFGQAYADYWVVGQHDINGIGYSAWEYNPGSYVMIDNFDKPTKVTICWVTDDSKLYYVLDVNRSKDVYDGIYLYGYDHKDDYTRVRFVENGREIDVYWDNMVTGLSLGFRLNK